jgi:hypothetical protein
MSGYHFERECRSPYSECYSIALDDDDVGRVDIHYTSAAVYATLCVTERLAEEGIRELISEIDERLVLASDPYREDFVVTIWAGREAAVYSDEDFEGAEEEEEIEGNGHRD